MVSRMTNEAPLGSAIKQARLRAGMSVRAAAAEAGISEGRWRQIELGYQASGGFKIPAVPKASTTKAMALAVGVDVVEALELAGHDHEAERERTVRPPAHSAEDRDAGGDAGGEEILFRLPPDLTPKQRERARRLAEASVRAYLESLDDDI